MPRLLKEFDPDSSNEEIRALSALAKRCWSPLAIVFDPVKAGSIDGTDDAQPHDRAVVRASRAQYRPSPKAQGRPEATVFVSGLSPDTRDKRLTEEMSRFGVVVSCRVVEDLVTGNSKRYAFVEFTSERDAMNAYRCAHRMKVDGSSILVDMEAGRTLPGWVPRRLGGGFNGRKESGQLRFGCRCRPFKKPIRLMSVREMRLIGDDKKREEGPSREARRRETSPSCLGRS